MYILCVIRGWDFEETERQMPCIEKSQKSHGKVYSICSALLLFIFFVDEIWQRENHIRIEELCGLLRVYCWNPTAYQQKNTSHV